VYTYLSEARLGYVRLGWCAYGLAHILPYVHYVKPSLHCTYRRRMRTYQHTAFNVLEIYDIVRRKEVRLRQFLY
jgi:hypothetical protein